MRTLWPCFFVLILSVSKPIDANADLTPQAISVALGDTSTCAAPKLLLGAYGDNIGGESVTVTSSDNSTLLSQTFTPASQTLNGAVLRNLSVPNAASKSSGLMAIAYRISSANEALESANFFIVMDCSVNSAVYSCIGKESDCPTNIKEFYPQLASEQDEIDFGRVIINGDNDYPHTLYVDNNGKLGLQIKSIEISGKDAAYFSFRMNAQEPGEIDANPIASGSYGYIEVSFDPNEESGVREALMTITSNDPFFPTKTVPIRAKAVIRKDLSATLKNVKFSVKNGKATFSGVLQVDNYGLKDAESGAVASIALYDVEMEEKYAATILKVRLPKIKKGKVHKIKFTSMPLSVAKHKISAGDRLLAIVKGKGSEIDSYNNYDGYYLE